MEAIIVSIITSVGSLIGVIITNLVSNSKVEKQIEIQQAVTDTKLDALTSEVRKHNSFAERIPVIENRLDNLEKEVARYDDGK